MRPFRRNTVISRQIHQLVMSQLRQAHAGHVQCIYVVVAGDFVPEFAGVAPDKLHVEGVDVMSHEDRIPCELQETCQRLFKQRTSGNHTVGDAVDLTCVKRYGHLRIHQCRKFAHDLTTCHFHRGDFHHLIPGSTYARGFQVENHIVRYV